MATKKPHKAFAERLEDIANSSDHVPPVNYGRLKWFAEKISKPDGDQVTNESVRKWFAGETKPREDQMAQLANLLGCDVSYLALGVSNVPTVKERLIRDSIASGGVNLVAGLIQMTGGTPAFPNESQLRSAPHIDLFAVIKGAQYQIHVSVSAIDKDGAHTFRVPLKATKQDCVIIGIRWVSMQDFALFEIDPETASSSTQLSGAYVVEEAKVTKRINTFSQRL